MARYLRLLAVLAVVALITSACGDSGDDAGGDGDGGGDTQATVTTADSDSDDTLITLGTLIEDLPGVDDECLAIANVFAALANASLALTGQAQIDANDAQALFDEAANGLPGDVQDDVQVMADGMIAFFQALTDAGLDFSDPSAVPSAEQFEQFNAAAELIDTAEFNAASDALSAYADEQCQELSE